MQAVNANGVPVVIAAHPMQFAQDAQRPYSTMRNYHAKQLLVLGSLQIVLGVLSIVFEAVSVGIFAQGGFLSLTYVGHGFWIGILFIVTGSFGIVGGKHRLRCHVIAFNFLSFISASFAGVLLILAVFSAVFYTISFYNERNPPPANFLSKQIVGISMESLLAFIAVIEAIVATWSSVVCCKIGACCCDCGGGCCCPSPANAAQIDMTAPPNIGQQIFAHQPFVMYSGYDQQQPIMRTIQQPMVYPAGCR